MSKPQGYVSRSRMRGNARDRADAPAPASAQIATPPKSEQEKPIAKAVDTPATSTIAAVMSLSDAQKTGPKNTGGSKTTQQIKEISDSMTSPKYAQQFFTLSAMGMRNQIESSKDVDAWERMDRRLNARGVTSSTIKVKTRKVKVNDLWGTQEGVMAGVVGDKMVGKGSEYASSRRPVVFRANGKLMVHDGHHDIVAHIQRGNTDMYVDVIESY